MHRFYCPHLARHGPLSDVPVALDSEQARHARTVLRLREGDCVEVFDGDGRVGEACIERGPCGEHEPATLRLASLRSVEPPDTTVDVACALPKGPRGAAMAASLSQVGASCLIPLRCERGVVDPRRINRHRFEKAAIESAKQCGRAHLLDIGSPATIRELLGGAHDVRLFGSPHPEQRPDPKELAARLRRARSVLILVGPEGGWTDNEHAMAVAGGCAPWRFGAHVMRIETACTAAVAIVRYLASGESADTAKI